MKISKILINDLEKPFGFSFSSINLNLKIEEGKKCETYTLEIFENEVSIFKRTNINIKDTLVETNLQTKPRHCYRVIITDNDENQFETNFESGSGNVINGKWIAGRADIQNNIFSKELNLEKNVKKARLYLSSQGVYELTIDRKKVSEEMLAPGFTNYNKYTQIYTYDITSFLTGNNLIEVSVGDGWFKGRLGFGDGEVDIYGDVQAIIGEMVIEYTDGETEVISTDESWNVHSGNTTCSGIYYGQDIDLTHTDLKKYNPTVVAGQPLLDRLSVPIKVMEELPAVALIITPKGEKVIDFGQNHSGVIKFLNTAKLNQKIVFEFGEILQEGNFYRENLREARARFEVISDGTKQFVSPNFTFFGYRYVKVEGIDDIDLNNFISQVIYSDIDFDTYLTTDNEKVNKLLSNVNYGQKSNFIDVPTDCPQRNERLGWTGDANIFGKTAMYSSNVVQFYKKYMKDVRAEQDDLDGMIPMYAPAIKHTDGGSSVWADVVTMLPWNVYKMSGDTEILKENYQAMKWWLDWVERKTSTLDNKYIWTGSFQFGDWLALDGANPAIPSGGTDENFIATVYYYMSAQITAQTAKILNNKDDFKVYSSLAENIKKAILEEYITTSGKMTLSTQTGYALMLESGLLERKQLERVIKDFIFRLNCDSNIIQTGFVGTPLLCPALSRNGYHNLAVQIFLNEEEPSWLYAVNMGATTIWERWNSVMPDGMMNPDGMNSLNHYAYGAIKEWVIEHLLGIQNNSVGFKEAILKPGINPQINEVSGNVRTIGGYLKCKWKLEDEEITIDLDVPIGTTVRLEPYGLVAGTLNSPNGNLVFESGSYTIKYQVDTKLIEKPKLNLESSLFDLANNKEIWNQLLEVKPQLGFFNDKSARAKFGSNTLIQVAKNLPFINFDEHELSKIEKIVKS